MRYSLITVVRGQEGWLAQTLRRNLDALPEDAELVVVDYASPNDTENLVRTIAEPELEAGRLVYVEVNEAQKWNLSHAKNVGHRCGQGDFLCNLDADNVVGADFFGCLDYDTARHDVTGFFPGGRVAVRRDLFLTVRGYDESFRGWGYEDQDLYDRARLTAGGAGRRRLTAADKKDQGMVWRNSADSDAPTGAKPNDTLKANSLISQANLRDKTYVVNPAGFGNATVYVNFSKQGTELT